MDPTKEADMAREIEELSRERDAYKTALQDSNAAFMNKVKEFSIIKRHSQLFTYSQDRKNLCLGILEIIIDETDAENCSLWLRNAPANRIELIAAMGQFQEKGVYYPDDGRPRRFLKLGQGAAGWVAESGKSLRIPDVNESEHFVKLDSGQIEDIQSLLCLPLRNQEGVFGVLNLSHPEKDAFSKDNELLLELITDQVGLAFSNYFLFREAQDFSKRLEHIITERTWDLKRSQERYALAIGAGKVGVWDLDIKSDTMYISPNLKTLLGFEEDKLNQGEDWRGLIHDDDRSKADENLRLYLATCTDEYSQEIRFKSRDGSVHWFFERGKALRDDQQVAYRIIGSMTDITELKQAEDRLVYQANHDRLTDLPNRTLMVDWISLALKGDPGDASQPFTLICFDLDRFKLINDSLGHAMGDLMIKTVSERVQGFVDNLDVTARIARLGGDEFALFIKGLSDEDAAVSYCHQLQTLINKPIRIEAYEVITTVSLGLVLCDGDYEHPESVLRDAYAAMNEAKTQGRSCHQVFRRKLYRQAFSRLMLENDLRRAVEDPDQLQVWYQPIVCLDSGRMSGLEALIRWSHPEKGLILPDEFISLAEETGLISQIGESVLLKACEQLMVWRSEGAQDFYLSVNMSTRQFMTDNVEAMILGVLEKTAFPPHLLRLEITESMLMQNFESAKMKLERLRAFGVKLLLDDFGTGYSSLNYLHQLKMDTIKVDASFVSNIEKSPQNLAIVKTVKALADALDMDVVAEGIENLEQLQNLKQLACEFGQGYFFSKPVEVEDARAMALRGHVWFTDEEAPPMVIEN